MMAAMVAISMFPSLPSSPTKMLTAQLEEEGAQGVRGVVSPLLSSIHVSNKKRLSATDYCTRLIDRSPMNPSTVVNASASALKSPLRVLSRATQQKPRQIVNQAKIASRKGLKSSERMGSERHQGGMGSRWGCGSPSHEPYASSSWPRHR